MKITETNLEFLDKFSWWTSPNGEFTGPEFFLVKITSILTQLKEDDCKHMFILFDTNLKSLVYDYLMNVYNLN